MAGHGSAPKDPDRRARTNADGTPWETLPAEPDAQPPLPEFQVEADGELVSFTWPAQTQSWWAMWGSSPMASRFTATDWSELLDTALLHADYWRGNLKVAGEIRLRVAKHGATLEDRLRLHIKFAPPDPAPTNEGESKPEGSRARRGGLHAVGE